MTAEETRDAALEQVEDNSAEWMSEGLKFISKLVGFEGTGEDLRKLMTEFYGKPHHHNAWGALIMNAVRKGYLSHTGEWRKMKGARSNARRTPVYRSTTIFSDALMDRYGAAGKRAYEARAGGQSWKPWDEQEDHVKAIWAKVAKAVMEG